jgi:hypothetical protein
VSCKGGLADFVHACVLAELIIHDFIVYERREQECEIAGIGGLNNLSHRLRKVSEFWDGGLEHCGAIYGSAWPRAGAACC